jgi:hypothetical protein
MKITAILAVTALILTGCANVPTSQLVSPAAVQLDIATVGTLVVPKVSAVAKATIHSVAVQLVAGQIDPTAVAAALTGLNIPASDQALVSGVVDGAVTVVNLAIMKFGSHNATTIAYVTAIGQGLLGAGF